MSLEAWGRTYYIGTCRPRLKCEGLRVMGRAVEEGLHPGSAGVAPGCGREMERRGGQRGMWWAAEDRKAAVVEGQCEGRIDRTNYQIECSEETLTLDPNDILCTEL